MPILPDFHLPRQDWADGAVYQKLINETEVSDVRAQSVEDYFFTWGFSHRLFYVQSFIFSEAFARIGGAKERFVKTGSTLQLNCSLHRMTSVPDYIFW